MAVSETELPVAAEPVWAAYQAMSVTKDKHIEYLQSLEDKYSKYGQASASENAQLDQLLKAHDEQVKLFRGELAKLKIEHPQTYAAVLQRLMADS